MRRASVRLRLTLTYTILFVTAFAAVLTLSYFLVESRTGGDKTAVSILCNKNGQQIKAGFTVTSPRPVPIGAGGTSCASEVVRASGTVFVGPGFVGSGVVGSGVAGSGVVGSGQQGGAGQQSSVPQPVAPPADASAPRLDALEQLATAVNASRDRTVSTFLIESLVALGVMALVAVGLGWWMAGRALKPVHRITDAARRLSGRNLHDRINLDGPNDELKELADTFDAMLARLDQAFTSQRRFVANASHELRTPLATERVLVDEALANREATMADLRAALHRVRASNEESEQLINALLALARSERGVEEFVPLDLADVARAAVARAGDEAVGRGIDVSTAVNRADAAGDPALMERLTANLLSNAIRHNHPGGWVLLQTGTAGDHPYLRVTNTGPPVDADTVATLTEPFRRGTGERHSSVEGLGLGLSIVDAVVVAHGAQLQIAPRPGGGLDVRVEMASALVVTT
jgi:signal transduction histidine kinase